jgi:putative ABC transport system permease protein
MEALWQDLRHGIRLLRRNPGFTAVAAGAPALGIGATSAIFSVVNSILLQPLPYESPQELVVVWEQSLERSLPTMYASPPNYQDWQSEGTALEAIGAYNEKRFFLDLDGETDALFGAEVTASLHHVLGVDPVGGRLFEPDDDVPGAAPVALLSHRLWQSRFGGDTDAIGQSIRIDGRLHTIAGVMPAGFEFPPPIIEEGTASTRQADIWIPFARDFRNGNRGAHFLTVIGRLRDDEAIARAQAEMRALASRLADQYPDSNEDWSVVLVPLEEQVVGEVRAQLLVLFGSVALVLLIACVNVANLLLAKGAARQRELAVRAALGAGRARLARQLLTESLLLSVLGGALGLVLAVVGLRFIVRMAPPNVPRLGEAGLDATVVLFTVAVSLLTGLFFGLVPALRRRSAELGQSLREGGRSGGEGRQGGRLRSTLVAAEVAMSLVLLVGAGLLIQSLVRLRTVDMGFEARNAVTMRVSLPETRYQEVSDRVAAFRSLEARLAALPAVEASGFIYDVPLAADRQGTGFVFEGEADPTPDMYRGANFSMVTPGYFDAMAIRLVSGRPFEDRDRSDSEEVLIVNETFARTYLPADDPFGRRLMVHGSARRIVGVVADVRHNTLREESTPTMYVPYAQVPWSGGLSMVVRSRTAGEALLTLLRAEVRRFDPALPVYDLKPMEAVLAASLGRERFATFTMGVFSLVALLLATVGIYGVISYSVSRRTHETGIRMALGAESSDVLRLVIGQGMRPVLVGAGLGLAASALLARTLGGLLYGVGATDPATLGAVVAILLAVSLSAIAVPARRATRVDPVVALRSE